MNVARPLEGKVVLVTRPGERAGRLSAMLRERGAVPVEAPTIRVEQVRRGGRLDAAIRDTAMEAHAWVAFTSAAGVEAWFARAWELGFDARGLRAHVAAVGSGTAEALEDHGVLPDLVPKTFTTEALGRAFPRGSGRVLLPRADIAPEELQAALERKGWEPVRVDAYRTRPIRALPLEARRLLRAGKVDAVTFTSASTVDGYVRAAGAARGPKVVCIGPVTARAARAAGLVVHAVARPHTLEGVVLATVRAVRSSPGASTGGSRRRPNGPR